MKRETAIFKFKIIAVFSLILLSAILIPAYSELISYSIEENCAVKLSALGAAQLSYCFDNIDKDFATILTLSNLGYLNPNTTLDNFIEYYKLEQSLQSHVDTNRFTAIDTSFTVVALPRNECNFKLRTFSISDDQRVRIWHGKESNFDKDAMKLRYIENWYDVSQWSKRVYGRSIQQEASSAAFRTKLANWLKFRKSEKYKPLEKNGNS